MTLRTISGRLRAAVQRRRLIAGSYRFQRVGFLVVVLGFSVPLAAADPAKHTFNIEAKPATQSLTDYARQAHIQLGYDVDAVADVLTNAVVGKYDFAEALELLLADTGLAADYGERGIFIRRVGKREGSGDIEKRTQSVAETNGLRLAPTSTPVVQATAAQNQTSWRTESDGRKDEEKRPLEEIIVTGTSIRGIAPDSSPTKTFTREDILITGAATAEDFVQSLPQNFGGGSNISVLEGGVPGDDSSPFNDPFNGGAGGASVNLRGLGSGATLVLLNGHRLAPSSGIGDFVDVSMIPASALERVEILTDGASSIYGGDAVAGVVNFILRDDFDGAEMSLRYGTVTEGDLDEYRANLTGGQVWDTGRAIIVYEYFSQDNLSAGDRSFSQNALLPNSLLPKQERHSALVSASQEVTPALKLFGDFTFSERKIALNSTSAATGNFFRSVSRSDSWNASAGGSWANDRGWVLDTSFTYSNTQAETEFQSMAASIPRMVDSKLWTVDAKASGTILQLAGGELKLAFGGHYRSEAFSNLLLSVTGTPGDQPEFQADRDAYAFFTEAFIPIVGSDNAMPGIARLEINASSRFDDYSDFGSEANPKVGVLWSPFEGLNLRGSYSTSFKPPPLGRVGARDRFVVAYPSLFINTILGQVPGDPSIADVVMINVGGTGKDIEAEESRAVTAGVDFNLQWGNHQLSAHSTYFDIEFDGRLGDTPVPDGSTFFNVPNIAFNEPELFPEGTVIFFPTPDQINDVLDSADFPVTSLLGADPLTASAINFTNVTRNLSLTVVRGLDLDVTYTLESQNDTGAFLLGLAATYLIDFEQQAAVTTPSVEQSNTLYNPVDLILRGHAGYTNNSFSANLFMNYTTDYRVDNTASAMPIDSWTTVDLSLSYDTRYNFGESVFTDTKFRLFVTNLLDNDPPSVPSDVSFNVFGYDPTNALPLGRFIAFELTKSF